MSGIYGALGLNTTDSQRVYVQTIGQRAIYDAVREVIAQWNRDMEAAMAVFVEESTDGFAERYLLPGGGRMQRRGGQAQSGAVKATGSWDVAYPLEEFGDQVAADRVAWGYMTMADLDRHLRSVQARYANTVRFEILKAILNNTNATFVDPLRGNLTIRRLANTDGTTYPPVLGSESEADDEHYLESNYAATAISDTNDPYTTIVNELEEHFGTPTGGSNIVVFINQAEVPETRDLTDFVPVTDVGIVPGDDTATIAGLPAELAAGSWRIIGRLDGAGCWVAEWRWMPANYMVGIHLDAARPLKRRVDPADTGLEAGLTLVSESDVYPFSASHYSARFGFGCGNRLNGVVMELGTGGTYTIPTGYS